MKKSAKICSVLLAALVSFSAAACNETVIDPTVEDTENLYIMIERRGYGVDWLYDLAEAFEEQTGINVEVRDTSSLQTLNSDILKGPTGCDTDIYFAVSGIHAAINTVEGQWDDYPTGLLELSDLYGSEIEGTEETFGSKMLDSFARYSNVGTEAEPEYYTVPWATGFMGMYYNIDVFRDLYGDDYEDMLPRTTDELYELALDIKSKGGTPFIFPGQLDYFSSSMFAAWWAQYEGTESYENFYRGRAYNEDYGTYVEQSKEIFRQTGRLEAIEAMYQLINYDADLYYRNGYSYGNNDYTDLQVRFLTRENKIAMMPNGDWLPSESGGENISELGIMLTPVISSITDRLTSITGTVEQKEQTLRDMIDYVDGKTQTAPDGVSEEDIEQVRIARYSFSGNGLSHVAYTPAFTNAKTNVYRFYRFMASDEGLAIYKQSAKNTFLPFESDYEGVDLSTYERQLLHITNNVNYVGPLPLSELFTEGGLNGVLYADGSTIESKIAAISSNSVYMNAQQAYENFFYSDAEWQQLVDTL